jgi:lysyl-tRNA synthetase class 2
MEINDNMGNKMTGKQDKPIETQVDALEQSEQRRAKLAEWRQTGRAYCNDFQPNTLAESCHQQYSDLEKVALAEQAVEVAIAGRMMTRRIMGKASFINLQDSSGTLQCYVRRNDVTEDTYQQFKHWDLGDVLAVRGHLFKTQTGELSVHATHVELLS